MVRKATELKSVIETRLMVKGDTPLTSVPATTRHYKPRARKCKCGCGRKFTPAARTPHQVYFDDNCRKRDHRRKASKLRKKQEPDTAAQVLVCEFCRQPFWSTTGRHRKYCKPSHAVMAAEHRRDAAIRLYAQGDGWSLQRATDAVDTWGMKATTKTLRDAGYIYDEAARSWIVPARLLEPVPSNEGYDLAAAAS